MTRSPATMRQRQQLTKLIEIAVTAVDRGIIGDVVAIVSQGRGKERQDPQGGDAEVLHVIEPFDQPAEIADAVSITVLKCLDVQLVENRVLEPQRVVFERHSIIGVGAGHHGYSPLRLFPRCDSPGRFHRSGKRPRLPAGSQLATGPVAATSSSTVAASGLACPLEPSTQPGRLRLRHAQHATGPIAASRSPPRSGKRPRLPAGAQLATGPVAATTCGDRGLYEQEACRSVG